MAAEVIADRVGVSRRYMRAADLARDLADPRALQGYVVTQAVRDALARILAGLAPGSTQRAFRVTGPYGSGKSSFGILLAKLVVEGAEGAAATLLRARRSDGLGPVPAYVPLVLVGRRASLADELVRVLGASAASGPGRDPRTVREAAALASIRETGDRDVRPVLELLDGHARRLSAGCGSGLLLLVDEMGRYLEQAASNGATEDPSLFQQLAERASGAASAPLGVVVFLHHRFSDYVAGLGEWIEGEWARSAERYEEIAFQDSTDQILFMLGHAIEAAVPRDAAVTKASRRIFAQACARGLFTSDEAAVAAIAGSLHPLHPATVACLSVMARRFGQNGRSVFGFLQSLEPCGFQHFIHSEAYGPGTWYRPDRLFDYLAVQNSVGFRSPDRERRWQLALDAAGQAVDMAGVDRATLKFLSLVAVLEPVQGLRSDAGTIAWCIGASDDEVAGALARLAALGVAFPRPNRGDYGLWASSSMNLEHWLEEAREGIPAAPRIGGIVAGLPPARPIVAHRHYHRTGTLRSFSVALTTEPSKVRPTTTEGTIHVVPMGPGERLEEVRDRLEEASLAAGPLALFCLRRVLPDDLRLAHDVSLYRWMRENCAELRVDDLARTEVAARLAAAEAELSAAVAPFARPAQDPGDGLWFHQGARLEFATRGDLSRKLSAICDQVFADTPILRNELVNRSKLSSAVAAARMRLLELMAGKPTVEFLGLEGAPPERTIYLSMLHASGLHRADDGGFRFSAPGGDDPLNWGPAWDRIGSLVSADRPVPVDEVMRQLALPPYGLNSGPALVLVAAFMLHDLRTVALMERNSFQPELTSSHFMRLAKTPANFSLRRITSGELHGRIIDAVAAGLVIWPPGSPPDPSLKPIVQGIYHWRAALPAYALQTAELSKFTRSVRSILQKAREPVDLVLDDLPRACGAMDATGVVDAGLFVERLNAALEELGDAGPRLRARVVATLLDAFATRSLADLREQVRVDFTPHVLGLTDYRLRAFVDRAMNGALAETAWLDGVASLVAGRRLDAWEDTTLDAFSFEVRELAQRLARWLALARTNAAAKASVMAVHLTAPDGRQTSFFVRSDGAAPGRERVMEGIRRLLEDHPAGSVVLAELLAERHARDMAEHTEDA